MSEKRKIQRFNLDEGRIWEAIEGLSPFKTTYALEEVCEKLNEQQAIITKQERIIKSQDEEINRQYNLCLAMSGVLREEFGVYDVFDRTKDKKVE